MSLDLIVPVEQVQHAFLHWGMECPLTLKLSDTERRGWSKVDMWQMNREPLVFSHQEHYGWDLERRNAKNKMWSNSPDGWSV